MGLQVGLRVNFRTQCPVKCFFGARTHMKSSFKSGGSDGAECAPEKEQALGLKAQGNAFCLNFYLRVSIKP